MGWSRKLIVIVAIAAVVTVLWSYLRGRNAQAATTGNAEPAP
jgi:hypothetical protein